MDDKVAAVVRNWSARFVANEVDSLELEGILARIEDWDDWDPAWDAAATRYEDLGRDALAAGHHVTAAAHLRRAALTLQFAQFVLTEDVAERGRLHRRQCELYASAAPLMNPAGERYRHEHDGVVTTGYLRRTASTPGPAPLVVLLPGLESTKEQFSTFEPYFLERGMSTLSVEGPGQGEGWYAQPFDLTTWLDAVGRTVVTFAGDTGVDGSQVVIFGSSFGGHLALQAATAWADLDPSLRIVSVVDVAGPYAMTDLAAFQPVIREGFTHLTHAADEQEATDRLADVTLDGVLARIDVPVLVVHGDADNIIPVEHGDRIVRELGERATYHRVEGGSHSCNNHHVTVRPIVADWVSDHLVAP